MLILGIETSCDDTSVALVKNGTRIVSSDVSSQIKLHATFGGIVPELASRAHIQRLTPMIGECLERNRLTLTDVDAIAVTVGPGLVGALLVGVETAKALSLATGKQLIPVNHVSGHLYSPFLEGNPGSPFKMTILEPDEAGHETLDILTDAGAGGSESPGFPYVGLVVSGGHSSLALVTGPGQCRLLGETVDDAAGEAFDKVAKLLELGYPGGPLIEKIARTGNPAAYPLPRPMLEPRHGLQFSFSGLKTAIARLVTDLGGAESVRDNPQTLADVCASFQQAVVDVLIGKLSRALEETGAEDAAIVGGVACNGALRKAAADRLADRARIVVPHPFLCTDNAAMIAGLAWHLRDVPVDDPMAVNAQANLAFY